MDPDELLDEIMEVIESEPEGGYGDPFTNERVRNLGIRARLYDLLQERLDGE